MLPRAAPRPRAGACTLESSLRCLTCAWICSPWGVENSKKSTSPGDAGPALPEPASAYPEARMLPRAAPRPRAGACTLKSSLRCLRTSDRLDLRGVIKIRKNRPPPGDAGPALQQSRHLLTQRCACCPRLPRGPEQAPAPWSPPSAACAPRIVLFSLRKVYKIDLPPAMLERRCKSRHLLTQRRACCPRLPRGPEQAPAPWSPPSAACARRIVLFSVGC